MNPSMTPWSCVYTHVIFHFTWTKQCSCVAATESLLSNYFHSHLSSSSHLSGWQCGAERIMSQPALNTCVCMLLLWYTVKHKTISISCSWNLLTHSVIEGARGAACTCRRTSLILNEMSSLHSSNVRAGSSGCRPSTGKHPTWLLSNGTEVCCRCMCLFVERTHGSIKVGIFISYLSVGLFFYDPRRVKG